MLLRAAAFAGLLVAGCHGSGGGEPSPPSLESFASVPSVGGREIAADPAGNLYGLAWVPNGSGARNERKLFRVTPAGAVTYLDIPLTNPGAVATDTAGNVYIGDSADCGPSPCVDPVAHVRRLASDGTVTPIAVKSNSDGTGTFISFVSGLAVDATGNVYISDSDRHLIRKLSRDGDLTTFAGQPIPGGAEGDGVGTMAAFMDPRGITMDAQGNLYVADARGQTIRRVTPDRVVSTLAGTPYVAGSVDGKGGMASFGFPSQLAVDPSGNVYVADTGNALIRKITPDGTVSTVAGTRGQRGFVPGPLPGVIGPPVGLALFGRDLFFTMDQGVGVMRNVP